jgi:hypothetical protein
MKQLRFGAMLFGAVLLTTTMLTAQAPATPPAGGQGGGRPGGGAPAAPPITNLQVLPKDMPRAQVITIMRGFDAALQVECGHCHVWTGPNLPTNDYASDIKPQKKIAREMLKMVMAANQAIGPAVQTNANRKAQDVTCATCHRGVPIPIVPEYPVPGAAPAGGARPGGAPAGAPGGAPAPGRQ